MIGIIYNPLSRKGQNRHRVEDIRKILDSKGFEYEYRETECPKDGIRVGSEMAETCDVVVAVGGDGTVYEVTNGIYDKGKTLGVLPFGSGNDIARSLDVFKKTDDELADMIMNPKVRKLDVGGVYEIDENRNRVVKKDADGNEIDWEHRFMIFASYGIIPKVTEIYLTFKNPGKTAYFRAGLKAVMKHKPRNYHIVLPDREFDCNADFVAVQNVKTAGGGLILSNGADDSDGKMDLIILHHQSRFRLIMNILALATGKLDKQKNAEKIPITSVDIMTEKTLGGVDGELTEFGNIHVEVIDPINVLH